MPIATDRQYARARNDVKTLEKHLDSLTAAQRQRLFELQNDCYAYLQALPPARQDLLLGKE